MERLLELVSHEAICINDPLSKAIWLVVAPTNILILVVAAATLLAVLRPSKRAAWLAIILVIGGRT